MTFKGTVQSDFLKLITIPEAKKEELIDYSALDFRQLRDKLVEYIKAVYPLDYNNFVETDLGLMLIELVAYMGAVMSLKADMLANENFLRTAKNRNNVRKLLELIGVGMKGPIGAAGNASLTLNSPANTQVVTIPQASRVVTVTSPEDGAPVNYTVYKVLSTGEIATVSQSGDLELDVSESDSSTSSVWSNLAYLEGALVSETGTFNSTDTIKRIPLTQSPVIQNSVEVFITNDGTTSGAWKLVENLYFASGSNDKTYQVVYNDNLTATVIFGDGILGSIPGNNASYSVTYRVGGGTRGNINSEVINTIITTNEGTQGTLQNTSLLTGGRDAESIASAKKYAPYTFKRQDRLVTLEDYTSFANTYVGQTGSTGKARAVTRDAYSSANNVDIYILQVASNTQLQQATVAYKKELLNAINEKKTFCTEVTLVDGLIRTLDLVVTLRVQKELSPKEEEIKGKARNALLEFFNVDNFDFGETLVLSDIVRVLFNIPEIKFATVDNLTSDIYMEMNEIVQLNNFTIQVTYV
jgi:hypothetical protein